jgi:hypothetical protein
MALESGVVIGDFRIDERLGAGGMGVVYKARQVSLNRPVALKVLGASLTRRQDVTRFQREAQAAAKLNHPGIATVYFVGQDEQLCYLAMEYIDGVSLDDHIKRLCVATDTTACIDHREDVQTVPVKELANVAPQQSIATELFEPKRASDADASLLSNAAEQIRSSIEHIHRCCGIIRDAAAALEHAHAQGVVHRDLKPSNIMLAREGNVKVIDFGLARFFNDVTVTHTGQLVGTPVYMSPEQVTGRIELDGRSDVYSLGLVLYELLALQRPISAPTRQEVLRQIVSKTLPPITRTNPGIPAQLQDVIHKAVDKDPDKRYQKAGEFAEDLVRFLEGKTVKAPRYRHQFDKSQIIANRPIEVMIAAFAAQLIALIAISALLQGIFVIATDKVGPLWARSRGDLLTISYFVALFCLTPFYVRVGISVMAGHQHAWWAAVILGILEVSVCAVIVVVIFLQTIDPTENNNVLLGLFLVWPVAAIPGLALTCLLQSRRAKDWFRFAARRRNENVTVTDHGR